MIRAAVLLVFALVAGSALRAGVIVSTSGGLTGLTITPDSGTLNILPGMSATAFGQVIDDPVGGSSFDGPNTVTDAATSASTSTLYANASASVSAPALTAGALTGVNLPGIDGPADTEANSQLSGSFEIADGGVDTNPVNVTFSADLALSQSLFTDLLGISASSEVIFQLSLPDDDANGDFIGLLLFSDTPLTIASDSSESSSLSPTLTGSALLQFNTPYSLFAEVDSESSGVDSTPEPSTLWLAAAGLAAVLARRSSSKG